MNYWEGPARWINTILLVIVGFIGFDTLFELLSANEDNVIVGFTQSMAGLFLAPFQGMFPEQDYLLTALIAILGYSLLAGIALAVTRSIQASRQSQARAPRSGGDRPRRPASSGDAPGRGSAQDRGHDDRTRQL